MGPTCDTVTDETVPFKSQGSPQRSGSDASALVESQATCVSCGAYASTFRVAGTLCLLDGGSQAICVPYEAVIVW